MGNGEDLEPAGQAFRKAPLEEERSRSQHHHPERNSPRCVLVPQTLDGLGPRRDLLDFVEGEHGTAGASVAGNCPGGFPLGHKPGPVPEGRLVGGGVVGGLAPLPEDLADEVVFPSGEARPGPEGIGAAP